MQPHQLQLLFDEHSAALVLYARQWCALPDDAVQEAFIDLANSPVTPNCPKAWLYTTTRRKAQNLARSERRRQIHQSAAAVQREQQTTWFRSTDSKLLVAEDVVRELELLENDQREVLVARIWGELSFEELAQLLECSVSSAHRRYSTALKQLKAKLAWGENAASTCRPTTNNSPKRSSPINQLAPPTHLADGEMS